ncbi:hypothetical protein AB4Z54_07090, partial [Streptomyces sp. MCAF7]
MRTAELFDSGELATILREDPEKVGYAVQSASYDDRLDVLEFVLRHEPPQFDLDAALSTATERRGSAAFVRTLLAAGARPAPGWQRFPLWAAATVGDADTVRLLLEAGADPNARTDPHPLHDRDSPDGCRLPLVGAIRADAHAAVAALLDGGADPNALTDALRRPLDVALETGGTAIAELLCARGATVFAPEEADLVQATRRGFLARVRELLPTQEPAAQGGALIVAVQERQVDVAVAVLERGEVGANDLEVALGQAIAFDVPAVVPHLITAGVDTDAPGNHYRTPPIVLA